MIGEVDEAQHLCEQKYEELMEKNNGRMVILGSTKSAAEQLISHEGLDVIELCEQYHTVFNENVVKAMKTRAKLPNINDLKDVIPIAGKLNDQCPQRL